MKDYVNAMPLELVYVSPTDIGQWDTHFAFGADPVCVRI